MSYLCTRIEYSISCLKINARLDFIPYDCVRVVTRVNFATSRNSIVFNHQIIEIMIQYIPVKRKSPRDGTMKFFAATAPVVPIKKETLLPLIEKRSTMASPDVRSFLDAFEFEMKLALSNNQSIRLSQLGSFRPTVSSKGYATEALAQKAGANAIQKVHARFRPCPAWKALENIPAGTNEVSFALYVPPVAATTVTP